MQAKVVLMTVARGRLETMAHRTCPEGCTLQVIDSAAGESEKRNVLRDADFLLGGDPVLTESVLNAATKLKLIQLIHTGHDTLDLAMLHRRGVPLATAAGLNAVAVAEHTIALILALIRKIPMARQRVAAGGWRMDCPGTDFFTYRELMGKQIGILGFGAIGRQVAQRLRAFDCPVQVYQRKPIAPQDQQTLGITQVGWSTLLTTSDILTLHLPLTPQTQHLLGREQLAMLKRSAILINTSRGAILDELALIEALQQQRLLGAALDVTEVEPPAWDNPLRTMDCVVLTPHVAVGSVETWERVFTFCWNNFRAVWQGRPPQNQVLLA